MHNSVKNLKLVKDKVNEIVIKKQLKTNPTIIAVSKTFDLNKIFPVIEYGHLDFGENKVQEAEDKWTKFKSTNKNIKLHMLGKLQSNKVKKAVKLFDFIHSLDSERLALKISQQIKELNKSVKIFIQVNLGSEPQKSGLMLSELNTFYKYCTNDLSLNIQGLMCLPPIDSASNEYFKILKDNSDRLNLKEISMGMSSDFENAIVYGSTYLRLGTAIFGKRS